MEWIRNVRVENGKSSFGDAIKPALAVVDAALPSATGPRRADLLAHTGWATFLLWRDGDRRLNPADAYREALSIDPGNPFANAMLAHWTLFQDRDAVAAAAQRFDTAVDAGRALDAVRTLQWAAYTNADSNPEAVAARVRLANAMRVAGARWTCGRRRRCGAPYYFACRRPRERPRILLDALAPDEHISTLNWAFRIRGPGRIPPEYDPLLRRAAACQGRTDRTGGRSTAALDQELAKSHSSRIASRCGRGRPPARHSRQHRTSPEKPGPLNARCECSRATRSSATSPPSSRRAWRNSSRSR